MTKDSEDRAELWLVCSYSPAHPGDRLQAESGPITEPRSWAHTEDAYLTVRKNLPPGDYVAYGPDGDADRHGLPKNGLKEVDRFSIRPPQQEPVTVTGFRSSE